MGRLRGSRDKVDRATFPNNNALRSVQMIDETPSNIDIPMSVIYQTYRNVAQAAVAEIRRLGYTMSDEQARELESRLEYEILRAWTAQKASN